MMSKKLISLVLLFSVGFILVAAPGQAALGVEVSDTMMDDFSLTVTAKGMTVGTDYVIETSVDSWSTNTTQVSFTASEEEQTFFFSVDTSGLTGKTLHVGVGTAAGSCYSAATATVYYPDDDDIVNPDSIINFIINIAIIVIPILIVKRLMRSF